MLSNIEGLSVGELGVELQQAMLSIPSALGTIASQINKVTHLSFSKENEDSDLFPLPFYKLSTEELADLHNNHDRGEGELGAKRWKLPTSVKRMTYIAAWVFCMITAVNFMYLGFGTESTASLDKFGPITPNQYNSLQRFYLEADFLVGDNTATCPGKDWTAILENKRVGYDGEVVCKAVDLTYDQVVAALPPENLGGSVSALDLCDDNTKAMLLDPSANIKDESEWPDSLAKARMRISDEEWGKLAPELLKRQLCGLITPDQLIHHNGSTLTSGLFGVEKDKKIKCAKTGNMIPVLRLIVNLVPSNDLQHTIMGDILTLPHFGQWHGLELLPDEQLIWASEDIQCAFYVFRLPECWLPWFALGKPLLGKQLGAGKPDQLYHLALQVVPMGWKSAVGLCQMFLRKLFTVPKPLGASLPTTSEIRKDRPLPVASDQRLLDFFQGYIDNWDAGSVCPRSEALAASTPLMVDAWQADVCDAYDFWGVPRSVDKSTRGSAGATLGAAINGQRGWIGLSDVKAMDMAEQTWHALRLPCPSRKEVSMLGGRWIFAFQFKRPLMVILMKVFDVINLKVPAWLRIPALAEELIVCLAFLPLLGQDLRNRVSTVVTCSDASETGGGACCSAGISSMGLERICQGMRSSLGSRVNGLCLMETFSGVSGGRKALETCGVTPALHLHMEIDEACLRVVSQNYPDGISLGDVSKFGEEDLRRIARDHPSITHVLHVSSPPCQQVTGLNPMGAGVHGDRSSLVFQTQRIQQLLHQVFPKCEHAKFLEMVASLSEENQQVYNDIMGCLPIRICPSFFCWTKRPRLFWADWPIDIGEGVKSEEAKRWTTLKLNAPRMAKAKWLKRGWKTLTDSPTFPTMVRATPRDKPPFMPAGLESLEDHELARYKQFRYIYPPYQFQDKYMVVSPKKVIQPLNAEMREVLMGFDRDFTLSIWKAADRRSDPNGYELARCSAMGNSFHVGTVAWLFSHLLCEWDILQRPLSVAEAGDVGNIDLLQVQYPGAARGSDDLLSLVRFYLARLSHRGGEVTWLGERVTASIIIPKGIDPREWRWRDIISTKWRMLGEHINVLECRAVVLTLRWRFRSSGSIGSKFLHLVDSRVTMGAIGKGRTSSFRLRRVLCKVNALLLAGHSTMAVGFTRTHLNPSDRPSRRGSFNNNREYANFVAAAVGQPTK